MYLEYVQYKKYLTKLFLVKSSNTNLTVRYFAAKLSVKK